MADRRFAKPATSLLVLAAVLLPVGVAQGASAAAASRTAAGPAAATTTAVSNVLAISGAFVQTLKLNKADCTSAAHGSTSGGVLDVFGASSPSIRSTWPELVVTAEKPDPKDASHSGRGATVDVVLNSPGGDSGWVASNGTKADVSFESGARGGHLDLTLMPVVGTSGVVFLSVTWTNGTCSTHAQRLAA